jgi:hypothetical protein
VLSSGDANAMFEIANAFFVGVDANGVEPDRQRSLRLLRRASELDHADAQRMLVSALLRGTGLGTSDDDEVAARALQAEAEKWIRHLAATHDDASAQCSLGLLLRDGAQPDVGAALKWLQRAVEQGEANAQYELARMYVSGVGVSKDLAKACELYRLAAEQGHPDAQFYLSSMLHDGAGMAEPNKAEAHEWLKRAADAGHADAQCAMAETCIGQRNEGEAIQWYTKAAEQGVAIAQFNLGAALVSGRGVPADKAAGTRWLERAASQPDPNIQYNVALIKARGELLPADLTGAFKLFSSSAEQGHMLAQFYVGQMLRLGQGVDKPNMPVAVEWYTKSAEQGYAFARKCLAQIYLQGVNGVDKNVNAAIKWLQLAADDNNDADAQVHLALMLRTGTPIERQPDDAAAFRYFQRAADQNHPAGLFELGVAHYSGRGTPANKADRVQALACFKQAAELGNSNAALNIGTMLSNGDEGVPKDEKEAQKWFKRAEALMAAAGMKSKSAPGPSAPTL